MLQETGNVTCADQNTIEGFYAACRCAVGVCSKSNFSDLFIADTFFWVDMHRQRHCNKFRFRPPLWQSRPNLIIIVALLRFKQLLLGIPNMSNDDAIVIASAARTPMGGLQGALSSAPASLLGSTAVRGALTQAKLAPEAVEELLFGCVLPAAAGQSPARQVALQAGLPNAVSTTTVNKVCGSGMKTIMMAHDQIKAGSNDVVIAGGMESMSNAPYMLTKARGGYRIGHDQVLDHMMLDGLQDAGSGKPMGVFAQQTADALGINRERMDTYAIESLSRAQAAIANGYFVNEIAPVEIAGRKGSVIVDTDEQPGQAKIEKIPSLRAAFTKDGTITAANASSISDGAAATLIMRMASAKSHGVKPLAKIVAHSSHAQLPAEFCLAPAQAINQCLNKAGWCAAEVDLFEINEAFAMVTLAAMDALSLEHSKVNIHGGACALGHPLGASGNRIVVTLIHALRRTGGSKGIASLCIGGGEATALAVELL